MSASTTHAAIKRTCYILYYNLDIPCDKTFSVNKVNNDLVWTADGVYS